MDFLQLLQRLLIQFGGGNGDPYHETVKHALPLVAWFLLFFIGSLLVSRRPESRNQWLLVAMGFAIVRELFYVLAALRYALFMGASDVELTSLLDIYASPWSAAALTIHYLLFVFAIFYSMGRRWVRQSLNELLTLIFIVGGLVFLGCHLHLSQLPVGAASDTSTQILKILFAAIKISVLVYAISRTLLARNESATARIAWLPFSLYLISEVLSYCAIFNSADARLWLTSISNNVFNLSTIGFGVVLWKVMAADRSDLTQKLSVSERLDVMSALTAGVAHDFNNHLQSIMGYAEVGKHAASEGEVSQQDFDHIIRSAERARLLVSQLNRFNNDLYEPNVTDISLPQVISDLSPMVNGLLGRGIEIHNHLNASSDFVRVDRNKLEQAIVNVVVNARDAMPLGGKLTFRSERMDAADSDYETHMVRLFIQDTGSGMSESEKRRVFEPFYTTKRLNRGSGLGLSTSLTAIRTMGGEMHIDTEPNRGTTLIIDLPASSESAILDRACYSTTVLNLYDTPDIETFCGTERILLADDEPGARHIATSQLRRAGYEVSVACDGAQAMELVQSSKDAFELILLDVIMPKKDGYTVYQELKALHPNVPVVFVTANTHLATHAMPAEPHLTKPYKQQALLQLVRTTLDSQQSDSA